MAGIAVFKQTFVVEEESGAEQLPSSSRCEK